MIARIVSWIFLLCATTAHGEGLPGGVSLNFNTSDTCPRVSLLLYSHSTHPGGDRNGILNENNKGVGFRCYRKIDSWWYWTASGIYNSQYGNTFVAGPGFHLPSLQLGPVDIEVGAELPYVYYESPRSRKIIYGLLPVPTVRLGVRLPGDWRASYVQHHLADTRVRLYAVLLERRF